MTRHSGFTLIETVMFIVVVSIAVAAISQQVIQSAGHSADPLTRQRAVTILHQYLDQMQTAKWDTTTPDGGGAATTQSAVGLDAGEVCTLGTLDDFDDFDCFDNTDLGESYTVDITVTNGAANWGNPVVPAAQHKKAVINVSTPIGDTLSITLYRANYQ